MLLKQPLKRHCLKPHHPVTEDASSVTTKPVAGQDAGGSAEVTTFNLSAVYAKAGGCTMSNPAEVTAPQGQARRRSTLLDTTVVHEFVGYTTSAWAMAAYRILVVLTGGFIWMLGQYIPQTTLWTMQQCPLSKAEYVHAKWINGRQELVKVQEKIMLRRSFSYMQQSGSGDFNAPTIRLIKLLLIMYVYDTHQSTFIQLPDMPASLPVQIYNARKALQLIDQGADWSIFNHASSWQRQEVAQLYGCNDMTTGRPSFLKMVGGLLVYPLYVIQYYELAFKFYEHYYQLAGTLLYLTIQSSFLASYALYQKRIHLFKSVGQKRLVPIVQSGHIRAISSRWLVPGDVVVLLPGKATCDMVLLQGNCLVEESMLSGEAAQVRKSGFVHHEAEETGAYRPETHHSCTIHAGTSVHQVWTEDNTADEVLAMVVRTGLRSTAGNMLQQIVAPLHDFGYAHDPFLPDMARFFGVALVLNLIIFGVAVGAKGKLAQPSATDIVQRILETIVAAVPIGSPTMIICALGACTQKLRLKGIDVLNPGKLKLAADVSVVCFDKTGTLTGSVPELYGMLPVEDGKFTAMQRMAVRWPNRLKQAAAVCNSLTFINKHQVVGDAADKQAFKAVEARFVERNLVSLPLRLQSGMPASLTKLQVLKRFEFESCLMRSGVVAVDPEGPPHTALLFVRGAPAKIEQLVKGGVLPDDYRQRVIIGSHDNQQMHLVNLFAWSIKRRCIPPKDVLVEQAAQSYRLMALAVGVLRNVSPAKLANMNQLDAEAVAGHMDLLGLLVLSNHLHPTSKDTISHLQDKGGIRTMMVTGDYHHTAIAVARGVGMILQGGQVVIIQAKAENEVLPRTPSRFPSALKISNHQARLSPLSVSFAQEAASPSAAFSESAAAPAEGQQREEDEVQRAQRCYEGLTFMLDSGDDLENWDPQHALTIIAQGSAQCCVTGPAFEHMLQQAEASVVETVMANVTVFARMQSRQKGQVMDLLGRRGLFQNVEGQRRHIAGLGMTCMYCGDGINDLVALAAADVGLAVGSSHASAAASISDRHSSVHGVVTVLREARCSHVIKLSAIKYMVAYELLVSLANGASFYVDGSKFSVVQRATLDFVAFTLGIVGSLRNPVSSLTPARPPQHLTNYRNCVLLIETMIIAALHIIGCLKFLEHQSWYTGGNGESEENPVLSTIWAVCLIHVLLPVVSFSTDTSTFCQRYSKPGAILMLIYTTFTTLCGILGPSWFDATNLYKFYHFKFFYTFKFDLIGWAFMMAAVFVLTTTRRLWDRHDQHLNRVAPLNV